MKNNSSANSQLGFNRTRVNIYLTVFPAQSTGASGHQNCSDVTTTFEGIAPLLSDNKTLDIKVRFLFILSWSWCPDSQTDIFICFSFILNIFWFSFYPKTDRLSSPLDTIFWRGGYFIQNDTSMLSLVFLISDVEVLLNTDTGGLEARSQEYVRTCVVDDWFGKVLTKLPWRKTMILLHRLMMI